jgi:hypothetical protein
MENDHSYSDLATSYFMVLGDARACAGLTKHATNSLVVPTISIGWLPSPSANPKLRFKYRFSSRSIMESDFKVFGKYRIEILR